MKEHLGAHYDRTSDFQQAQFETLIGVIKDTLPDAGASLRSLVDIGCGTGSRTLQLLKHFPQLEKITAIDPDWEMIELAEKKYADPRIEYRRLGAEDIPQLIAAGHSYDIAFSNWSVHWIKEKKKMLHDLHDAVRPGGYLAFSASQSLPDILVMIDNYLRQEFRVPADVSPFFHLKIAEWQQILATELWQQLGAREDRISRDVKSGQKYLEHWFTSSASKAMYGKHLMELSSLSRSDIVFMIERAFPSETPGMELTFHEDVMFMVAQRDK